MSNVEVDVESLTVEDRLRLLDRIWESFERRPESLPLTDAQRAELDVRIEEMDRDGAEGIPWEDVLRRIRDRSR